MNNYVVDANLLFSAFISGKEFYKKIIFENKFFTPDFCLLEIEKYEDVILKKTKLEKNKLKEFSLLLFSRISVIPRFIITNESIIQAFNLCKNIDPDDTMYLALSIELNFPLITRDIKLKNHIIENGYSKIILFDDFLESFFQ